MWNTEAKNTSKPSLNQILYEMTSEKIMELQRQKDVLGRYYSDVLKAADASKDLVKEIEVLYQGIKEAPVRHKTILKMESARLFIENVAKDSSTSEQLLRHWISSFRKEIQYSTCKCIYSYVYGKRLHDELSDAETTFLDSDLYVASKRKKELPTESKNLIKELEERAFKTGHIDSKAFKDFLNKTFEVENEDVNHVKLLAKTRKDTESFCKGILEENITVPQLNDCVEGLIASDLLNPEKQAVLRQLKQNELYLQDLAALLSSQLKEVKHWNWPEQGVYVDVRQSIAGRYQAFLDEDIITALFLHYIGVRFAVYFKEKFTKVYSMYDPAVVTSPQRPPNFGIERWRRDLYQQSLLSILPNVMQNGVNFSCGDNGNHQNTGVDSKNSLIHLLATDAQLHKVIKPDRPFTVVRTDMEFFGQSIEHESIKIVLQFFGVTDIWVDFMMRFLNVPMAFQKDISDSALIQRRGLPIAHQLSALFGECILFMMEVAVKRQTGIRLHRIYDDFWFWDSDQEKVVQAWRVMNEYANLVNLQFNSHKSGSAVINSHDNSGILSIPSFGPPPLPQAGVWWGYLAFRADGLFQIDHALVEPHIKEMGQKLKASKTVLRWVNVYNKYIYLFMRGFGSCTKILGFQHLVQIGECMKMIHMRVFHGQNGDALAALKEQFEVLQSTDIVDMWAYWPFAAGGLGMKNYLMEIGALRETFIKIQHTGFADLPEKDKELWEDQEKTKERNLNKSCFHLQTLERPSDQNRGYENAYLPQTFDKYCSERQTKRSHWSLRFQEMLEIVELATPVELDVSVVAQLKRLGLKNINDVITAKRVISHYDNQLGKACGSVDFLDMELIPQSLVQCLDKSNALWYM
jgi:DNA-binding ferritin-like protein (Dps family)